MLTFAVLGKALYLSWVLSEVAILIVTRTRSGGGKIQDRGSLLILWITLVASINLGVRFGDAYGPTMFGDAQWIRFAGLTFMISRPGCSLDSGRVVGQVIQCQCGHSH